jgi:hypothetical protein
MALQAAAKIAHFKLESTRPATKVRVFQVPKGASARYRSPRGAHPARLTSLVFVEVSSMKTSPGRALLKKGPRRVIQKWRSRAMSSRLHLLACRLFFKATRVMDKRFVLFFRSF